MRDPCEVGCFSLMQPLYSGKKCHYYCSLILEHDSLQSLCLLFIKLGLAASFYQCCGEF